MCLTERVGRRGAVLLFLALLDIVYSVGLYNPLPEIKQSASTQFLADIMPLAAWASLWLGVGVVLLLGAFLRHDRWAYAIAVGFKTLWGTVNLLGWAIAGVDRGWLSAAIWLAFGGIVLMISAWPEPPKDLFAKER